MPFAKGHPWRWRPGQSGNPRGRPKREEIVNAFCRNAKAIDVLDRQRMRAALDGLSRMDPRAYLRLMEQVWARKLGKAAKNVPKPERTTSPESHVP